MLELIIDTNDREDEAFAVLLAEGVLAESGDCINTFLIPESSRSIAEQIMNQNGIEWQWTCDEDGNITRK